MAFQAISPPSLLVSSEHLRFRPVRAAATVATLALFAALLAMTTPPAAAIEGGWQAGSSTQNRATVRVTTNGSTCTGVLVSPTLVLTARHCFKHSAPNPLPHQPRGNGFTDWQYPDRFYSLNHLYSNGVNVLVGNDSNNPDRQIQARSYSLPGNVDIALLKLDNAVPSSVATPTQVITRWNDNSRVSSFVSQQTFSVFGFGKTSSGQFSNIMQEGRSANAEYPCPRNANGWTGGDVHRLCAAGSQGGVRSGDSGGPLYLDRNGSRQLLATFQGLESARNGGRYVATFFRGGTSNNGSPLGDVGGWLENHLSANGGAAVTGNTSGTTAAAVVAQPQPQPQPQPQASSTSSAGCSLSPSANGVTARWSPIQGAATYVYAIRVNNGAVRYDRVNALEKYFAANPGSSIYVRVSAVYANNTYSHSLECGTATVGGGTQPQSRAATSGCNAQSAQGGVSLSWSAVSGSDYYVYSVDQRYFQTTNTQVFVQLSAGQSAQFRVAGFNSNDYPGRYSPAVSCQGTGN